MPWFQYSRLKSGGLPLVRVRLIHGNRSVPLVGVVDSGADYSLISSSYAEYLGLDRAKAIEDKAYGASSLEFPILKWDAPVEMQFMSQRFRFQGFFAEFAKGNAENLLGRSDFFNRFIVSFWSDKKLMQIDLSPDSAEPPLA